eukprot:gene35062-42463_t
MSSIVPIIDLSPLFADYESEDAKLEAEKAVARQIGAACENIGFLVLTGHNVPNQVVDDAWNAVKDFFDLPLEEKMKHTFPQEVNPFGYNPMGAEVLSSGKAVEKRGQGDKAASSVIDAPDLKEMYSVGPEKFDNIVRVLPDNPPQFAAAVTAYYNNLNSLAKRILRCFALALELDDVNFFEQFCTNHASALRAIHYPEIKNNKTVLPGQLRASAHTDYGTITILRADGPGLQVSKDLDPPVWHDVPIVPNCFIINLGDLMRRWTNDRWLSTLHRVIIPLDDEATRRRQSMAFFHNINRDAEVKVLLKSADEEPKHPPIIAGDFLLQKHLASLGMRT